MSNSSDQNGRQPPVPFQTAPPTDPRTRNVTDQQIKICRDYAWGICTKGSQCKFRHELDPEAMKSIIKFCHDFQNRTGCTRTDCTYLHSSREEETLFLTAGQIPRALAERHSAMSLAPTGSVATESIPQIMYMPESYMSHPPPRPSLAGMMQSVVAPPPPPPPPLPATALPPPPPPPPPTANNTSVRMTAPMFSGPPPLNPTVVYTASQPPPPLPPLFDASRPPPPLPVHPIRKTNIAVKRSIAADTCEAGPSKRKAEGPIVVEGPCENCVQREKRIEMYRQKMQKMHCEEEYQSLIYKKKLEEYETGRALLKSAIGPELFRILDEEIEGTSQSGQEQNLLVQYNQTPTIKPITPTVPNQLLLQLMECLLNKRNVIDSTPATPLLDVDELLQTLLALKRRQNPAPNRSSSDVLNTILEAMRNSATSSSSQERAEPPVERAGPSAVPSTSSLAGPSSSSVPPGAYGARFVNGQKTESAPLPAPVTRYPPVVQSVCGGGPTRNYSQPPAPVYTVPQPPAPVYTAPQPPAPVYTAPQPPAPVYTAPQPPVPVYHPPYQPAVPPPARPYYAHQHYHNAGANVAPATSVVYPSRVAAPPAVPAAAPAPAPPIHNTQYSYPPAPWRHPTQSRYYPPAQ